MFWSKRYKEKFPKWKQCSEYFSYERRYFVKERFLWFFYQRYKDRYLYKEGISRDMCEVYFPGKDKSKILSLSMGWRDGSGEVFYTNNKYFISQYFLFLRSGRRKFKEIFSPTHLYPKTYLPFEIRTLFPLDPISTEPLKVRYVLEGDVIFPTPYSPVFVEKHYLSLDALKFDLDNRISHPLK